MKRILLFLFCLGAFFATNAQYPATGLKQKLTNGVALGSKDSTAFTANDSLVLTIDRNGKLMWRGRGTNAPFKVVSDVATAGTVTNVMANNPISVTNATTTPIISLDTTFSSSGVTTRGRTKQGLDSLGVISFKYTDTTGLLSQVVRTFGQQNVAGVKTFTDSTKTPSLIITATADSSILFRYPAELKTLYRENTLYPKNFGFNIVPSQSNSFFTFTEEGLAHQAYYKGDGDGNTNIWGVSSKLNTDTGWIPRMVVNQNGFVGIGTNTPSVDLDVRGDAKAHTVFSNKSINGGADTLFSGDPYVGPINTTKTGFVHHYYGISDNQNGGGDITYFKENGIDYKRLPNIADRRVFPNREIWYQQYSAHNGVDSIYSRRSIAAIVVARASSNSTLGNMRGWYEIVTARDSGYKTPPTTKDFIVSEGRMAVNAPSNSTNATFTSTANIYGDLLATNGLISNSLILRNSPLSTNFETYVNGSALATRIVGNAFDNMQLRNGGTRPLLVRTSSSNPPVYLYNDASGGGLTISETEITGYYQTLSSGAFSIANAEIFRFNNTAGATFGVNTGNTLNANFHVRGSTSSTRAFLVSNNLNAELFRVNNNGAVLVGGASDNSIDRIISSGSILTTQYKLSALNTAPATASSTGTLGEIRITSDYIYVCVATNTWVRSALTTW